MIQYLLELGAEMISDLELESVSCLTPATIMYPRPSTGFFRGYGEFDDEDDLAELDLFRGAKTPVSLYRGGGVHVCNRCIWLKLVKTTHQCTDGIILIMRLDDYRTCHTASFKSGKFAIERRGQGSM